MINEKLDVVVIDFGLARTNPYPELAPDASWDPPVSKEDKKDLGRALLKSREDRKKAKRTMSPHVQTRIYRAPEVAILEKQYSFSIDIWSIGCILAELIHS